MLKYEDLDEAAKKKIDSYIDLLYNKNKSASGLAIIRTYGIREWFLKILVSTLNGNINKLHNNFTEKDVDLFCVGNDDKYVFLI